MTRRLETPLSYHFKIQDTLLLNGSSLAHSQLQGGHIKISGSASSAGYRPGSSWKKQLAVFYPVFVFILESGSLSSSTPLGLNVFLVRYWHKVKSVNWYELLR